MKKIIYCSSLIAVIALAGGARASQPQPAAPAAPRILMLAQAEAPVAAGAALPATTPPPTPENPADVPSLPPVPEPRFGGRAGGIGGGGGGMGGGGGGYFQPMAAGRPESSSLVIPSAETDPEALAAAEEDLTIMGRILEKALDQNGEEDQRQAMGIRLFSMPGSGEPKNLEIEGFGAVFLLNANFPLAGPSGKPGDATVTNETSNSTWDEAKQELYGPPPGMEADPFSNGSFAREEYDSKRVERLKDALMDALKNASNMRSLKPSETVSVIVTGGGGGGPAYEFGRGASGSFSRGYGTGTVAAGGVGNPHSRLAHIVQRVGHSRASVLTIRVKKSDIDSFAKGKLSRDEFRGKTTVLAYLTSSTTSIAAQPVRMNLQAK